MVKRKSAYVCSDCGAEFSKWQGQCDSCKEWNTLVEFVLSPASKSKSKLNQFDTFSDTPSVVQTLNEIDLHSVPRISTHIDEFDRVLGGGLVPGSSILIGGNPGAGKSTLLLQVLCELAKTMEALYVTGEESLQQVALRAQRLGVSTDRLKMLSETSVESICASANQFRPKILVVDSIQVMSVADITGTPGGITQVRESAAYLTRYAKQTASVLLLIGHVTKEGNLAGPKVLEHMIDCSIMLESSQDSRFRTLRASKNRFGAINELGIFAMTESGLREVKNPSAIFLSRNQQPTPGSIVMVLWEGTRPLLLEIQALVDDCALENTRRLTVGIDQNRLAMILAVLHRHGGINVAGSDVYVNVVGGVKVMETSADLAVLASIISSFRDIPLAADLVVFGEVGLSGEIRPVPSGQDRIREAAKHGFKRAIIPKANAPKEKIAGMEIIAVSKLSEAMEVLFD